MALWSQFGIGFPTGSSLGFCVGSIRLPKQEKKLRLTAKRLALLESKMWMADKAANWSVSAYRDWGMTRDEAWSDAVFWLIKCACRWSPKRKVKFSTYFIGCWKWWVSDLRKGIYSKWHICNHRQFDLLESDFEQDDLASVESLVPARKSTPVGLKMDLDQAGSLVKWKKDWELFVEGLNQTEIGNRLNISQSRSGQRQMENFEIVRNHLRDYNITPLKGKQGRRR